MDKLAEAVAEIAALDAKRTQGEWRGMSSSQAYEYSVYKGEYKADDYVEICQYASKPNRNFIAQAPTMAKLVATLWQEREQLIEAHRASKEWLRIKNAEIEQQRAVMLQAREALKCADEVIWEAFHTGTGAVANCVAEEYRKIAQALAALNAALDNFNQLKE